MSMSPPLPPPPELPPHPFTDDTADVILRTADGVEFRVHTLILIQASSSFKRMLEELPHAENPVGTPADSNGGAHPPALPVVDLTDSCKTVEHLLRLCYPMADPVIELEDFTPTVHAAAKYSMTWAKKRLGKLLVQHAVPGDPVRTLRAFAIASDLYLPEAGEIARASLREPLSLIDDLPLAVEDAISAGSLYRLMRYRSRVHAAVVQYLIDPEGWNWIYKCSLSGTLQEWLSDGPNPYGNQRTLILWADFIRMGHSDEHFDYRYPYEPGGARKYIRLDAPHVIQALVKSTEELHNAFPLQIPIDLLRAFFDMVDPCETCRTEGLEYLRESFGLLEVALREVMFEVRDCVASISAED